MAPTNNPDVPQKNLESAIKLYDELQQVTKTAGKEAEFLQLSLKLKIKKEVLDSANNDLKTLYNQVVDQTQSNNVEDNTPALSSSGDDSDSKFTNTIGNGKTYKKAARIADRQENKLEKIDNYIKRKLDIDGVSGLVAAVDQLNQEVRSQYPTLFEKFDTNQFETSKKLTEKTPQSPEELAKKYSTALKDSKNPESLIGLINQDIDKLAKDTLVDKMGRSEGAVGAGKVIGGIFLAWKALGVANDAFPSGLEGFMLKILAGYTAYAGYGKYKDKILDGYKQATGKTIDQSEFASNDEMSHRNLESQEFKDGEIYFKSISSRFNNKLSIALGSYISPQGFKLYQFVADYSTKDVKDTDNNIVKPNPAQTKLLHKDMEFASTQNGGFDFVAQLASAIEKGEGSKYSAAIDDYVKGLGMNSSLSVQSYNETFTAYENTQKVRYNILKKAGYEIVIDKDASNKPQDIRSRVDAELQAQDANWSKSSNFTLSDSTIKILVDQGYIIKGKETKESTLSSVQERKKQGLSSLDSANEQREFVEEFDKSSQELRKLSTPDGLPNYPTLDYDDSWMDITKNKTGNTGNKVLYYENYGIRVPFVIGALNQVAIQGTDVHGSIKNIFYQMDAWAFAIATLHYSSKDQADAVAGTKEIFTYGEGGLRYTGGGNGIRETVMNLIGQGALAKRFALAATNGADGGVFADKLTNLTDRERPGIQGGALIPVRSMWSHGGNLPPHYLARHRNGQKITINSATIDQAVQTTKPEYDNNDWSVVATNWITKHGNELGNVTTAFAKVSLQIVGKALKAGYREVGNNLIGPDGAISLVGDVLIETGYEGIKITNKIISKGVHDISHNELLWKDLSLTTNKVVGLTMDTLEGILKGTGGLIEKVLTSPKFTKLLEQGKLTSVAIANTIKETTEAVVGDGDGKLQFQEWLKVGGLGLLTGWIKNGMGVPSAK